MRSEPAATATDEEVKEFLAAYGFEGGVSDRGADGKGVFPLLCAVLANDAPLVRALLKAGADPNLAYEGKQREGHFFALHQGTTAVHLAPLSDHSNDGVVMRELLRAGGDPGRVTSRGASPLTLPIRSFLPQLRVPPLLPQVVVRDARRVQRDGVVGEQRRRARRVVDGDDRPRRLLEADARS